MTELARAHPGGDDAGAKSLRCLAPARYPTIEDELDLLGPTEIEDLADRLFDGAR